MPLLKIITHPHFIYHRRCCFPIWATESYRQDQYGGWSACTDIPNQANESKKIEGGPLKYLRGTGRQTQRRDRTPGWAAAWPGPQRWLQAELPHICSNFLRKGSYLNFYKVSLIFNVAYRIRCKDTVQDKYGLSWGSRKPACSRLRPH